MFLLSMDKYVSFYTAINIDYIKMNYIKFFTNLYKKLMTIVIQNNIPMHYTNGDK